MLERIQSLLRALALVAAVGLSKELIYDKAMRSGTPSVKDFAWDLFGCAVGIGGGRFIARHSDGVSRLSFITPF